MRTVEAATKINEVNVNRIKWLKEILSDLGLLMTLDDIESLHISKVSKELYEYIKYLEERN